MEIRPSESTAMLIVPCWMPSRTSLPLPSWLLGKMLHIQLAARFLLCNLGKSLSGRGVDRVVRVGHVGKGQLGFGLDRNAPKR